MFLCMNILHMIMLVCLILTDKVVEFVVINIIITSGKIDLHVFSKEIPSKERIREYARENKWIFQTYSDLSPNNRLRMLPVASD